MDVENLSQFNKRLFKKYFGIYVRQKRQQLNISFETLALESKLSVKQIKTIESGQAKLSQETFDFLCAYLDLDQIELVNIGQITQIQNLMNVYKEIDEHYPG